MKKHNIAPRDIRRAFPNVTQVIDAKRAVEISVNAKDCKTGEPLNPLECALARAVKRQFHADAAVIGLGASYIIKENKATRFHTPERIRREIVSFDRHNDFAEGSYILVPKSPALKLGTTHVSKDKRARHDNAKRHPVKNVRVRILNTK